MSTPGTAVVLLAFGGPDSLDDIKPFLQNIVSGRTLPDKQIEEIKERYALIGGKSPLRELTQAQADALQKLLDQKNSGSFKVFSAMRYWHPFIKETFQQILNDGYDNVIAVIMAPQKSGYTAQGYQRDMDKALRELDAEIDVTLVSEFWSLPAFLEAVADKVKEGLAFFTEKEDTLVIFSPHSLPHRFMKPDDPYVSQIEDTIKGVLSITGSLNWKLAYQSKGMIPGEWLGPSVDSVLEDLPVAGVKNVLLVPIGFASDHVETLYDIDIVYKKKAETLGLGFNRSQSLNDSPKFIEALAEVVFSRQRERLFPEKLL